MAAKIVAEETDKMIIATKQLFYAMEVHKILHFTNPDMSAVSFAMTIHGLMDYELDQNNGQCSYETDMNLLDDYLKWFCEEECCMIKKKSLLNYCGLLGVAAFFLYTAAAVFSLLTYPGYYRMVQAVSDLSASNAPSLRLWNQLSSLYNVCTLGVCNDECVDIQGKKNKLLRVGIYLFTIMEWVSAVGFWLFPLATVAMQVHFRIRCIFFRQ